MEQGTGKTMKALGFEFNKMDPELSLRVLARLVKIGGPSISQILEKGFSGGEEGILDTQIEELLPSLLSGIAERLDEEMVVKTVKDILTSVRDDAGMEVNLAVTFRGKTKMLLMVCKEAIKFNYMDFFEGSKG